MEVAEVPPTATATVRTVWVLYKRAWKLGEVKMLKRVIRGFFGLDWTGYAEGGERCVSLCLRGHAIPLGRNETNPWYQTNQTRARFGA